MLVTNLYLRGMTQIIAAEDLGGSYEQINYPGLRGTQDHCLRLCARSWVDPQWCCDPVYDPVGLAFLGNMICHYVQLPLVNPASAQRGALWRETRRLGGNLWNL